MNVISRSELEALETLLAEAELARQRALRRGAPSNADTSLPLGATLTAPGQARMLTPVRLETTVGFRVRGDLISALSTLTRQHFGLNLEVRLGERLEAAVGQIDPQRTYHLAEPATFYAQHGSDAALTPIPGEGRLVFTETTFPRVETSERAPVRLSVRTESGVVIWDLP